MKKDQKEIIIGKIVGVQGFKGIVKLESYTNPKENIFKLPVYYSGGNINLKLISMIKNPILAAITYPQINNDTDAKMFIGKYIYVSKTALKNTNNNDEFYAHDLIGVDILNQENVKIGVVKNVNNFGSCDIIEIQFTNNTIEMYPFTKEFFPVSSLNYLVLAIKSNS